jgi:predicted NUDIX family NTP pyrophosphohydrolase
MYHAKVAVFVDDDLCDRSQLELIPLLSSQVRVESGYLQREFGVYVRVLWTSLEDVSGSLSAEQRDMIERLFRKPPPANGSEE